MRLSIIAVGRAGNGPEAALFKQYQDRLSGGLHLIEVAEKRPLTGAALKRREAELIEKKIPGGATVAALDERGKVLTSRAFAQKLATWADAGVRDAVFVIGGADGLDADLRKRADLVIAFGAATWPHQLVRVMLAEQLYRAQSIRAGHPYHRD